MSSRILISGGSIAGNALAWWLGRLGFDVTVIEKSPSFRDGGQNIDVRGPGREVLRRMHLEQAALAAGTGEIGTAWVDSDGRVVAEFLTDELEGDGPTAEMEILRGDLSRLLYDTAPNSVTFRFDTSIERVEHWPDGVVVTFSDGATAGFDLLVVAEGVGSHTRELVFPRANEPRWMNLTIGYFTIPRTKSDDRRWRWYNASGGRSVSLRPDPHGTTRAMLSIQGPPGGEHRWTQDQQKTYLQRRFADVGWEAPRVLAEMSSTADFYFDVLRQVRMNHWSHGRVVLLGDAAWCATPLAGIGATLAVTGAYVLAGELHATDDISTALAEYERKMRPMVDEGQGVPKLAPRLMNPHSNLGIGILHSVLRIASEPTFRKLSSKLFSREPKAPDLSSYPR